MNCWACDRDIALTDMANRLPKVGEIVHRQCYVEQMGHDPALRMTLADALRFENDAAA